MGRPPKPTAFIEGHRSAEELSERAEREPKVPFTDVRPPEFLTTAAQREEFGRIASMLVAVGIFTELDESTLGKYVVAEETYRAAMRDMRRADRSSCTDPKEKLSLQNRLSKAIKDCRDLAGDLGLNVTARCRIKMPRAVEEAQDALNL